MYSDSTYKKQMKPFLFKETTVKQFYVKRFIQSVILFYNFHEIVKYFILSYLPYFSLWRSFFENYE